MSDTAIAWVNDGPVMNPDGTIGEAPGCCCGGACCLADCSLDPCKPVYVVITASEAPVAPNIGYSSYTTGAITWGGTCEAILRIWDDSEYEGVSVHFDVRVRRYCDRVDLCGTCARNCTFTIEYSRTAGVGYDWKPTLSETAHPHPFLLADASIQYGDDFMGDSGGIKNILCDSTKTEETCISAGGSWSTSTCNTPGVCGACDCPDLETLQSLHFSISYNIAGIGAGTLTHADFSWFIGGTAIVWGADPTNAAFFSIGCSDGILTMMVAWNGLIDGCLCTSAEKGYAIPCSLTDRTWMAVSRSFTLEYPGGYECADCPSLTAEWTISYPC